MASLSEGQRVSYEVVSDTRGLKAVDLAPEGSKAPEEEPAPEDKPPED